MRARHFRYADGIGLAAGSAQWAGYGALEEASAAPPWRERLLGGGISAALMGGQILAVGGLLVVFSVLFGNGVPAGHVPVIAVSAGVVALWAFGWGAVVAAPWVSCRAAARVAVDSDHKVVQLYDLTDIAVRDGRDGVQLLLTGGSHPSTATLPLGLVEANPALWDLVYLGIRHSVAGGAHIEAKEAVSLKAIVEQHFADDAVIHWSESLPHGGAVTGADNVVESVQRASLLVGTDGTRRSPTRRHNRRR